MDNRIGNQKIGSKNNSFPSRGRWCEAPDEVCQKGISLISLIITIIVIIILAAIVIFNGFGATESAQFAKFSQELSNYQEEMDQKFLDAKRQSLMQGETKTDSEIYAEIAGGEEKTVSSVLDGKPLSDGLNGTSCYEIQGARNIYGGQTGIYITDKGEVFTMPGYKYSQEGNERRYVNASMYYAGNSIETSGENTGDDEITFAKTELDSGDSSAEMWSLLGAIAEEISNNAGSITSDSGVATVTINVNGTNKEYTIRIGDTYKVYSTVEGFEGEKIVRVLGFNHDTLASDPNKTAGISFEFVNLLMSNTPMHNTYSDSNNGWVEKDIYATLNSGEDAAWKSLSNSEEIKEVTKTYITDYNTAQASTSNDRL